MVPAPFARAAATTSAPIGPDPFTRTERPVRSPARATA